MSSASTFTPIPATWVELLHNRAARPPNRCAHTFFGDGEKSQPTYAALRRQARAIGVRLLKGLSPDEVKALLESEGSLEPDAGVL